MRKIGKKGILSFLSLALSVILLFGMITATILLQQDNRKEWNYYTATQSVDYYGDTSAYGFQCVFAFKKSLISYFSSQKSIKAFIGSNSAIDTFVQRIVKAMSDARIAPAKLEKIAEVLSDNSLPTLLNRYVSVLEQYGTFEKWLEEATETVTQTNSLSLACEFVSSFLKLTTLSEDELSSFIYYYLYNFGSEEYKVYLFLYGQQYFTSLLSDTFFAMRTLQSNGTDSVSFSMTSLRSALYELGTLYLSLSAFSEKGSLEMLLGFPSKIPTEISGESAGLVDEYYVACLGSMGELLIILGAVMQTLRVESLENYFEFQQYEKNESENIAGLQEKFISGQATEEEIELWIQKLSVQNAKKILSAQTISKDIVKGLEKSIGILHLDCQTATEVVEHFYDISYMLRQILYSVSTDNENEEETLNSLNTFNENFQEALIYFADKEYTYEEILAMDTSLESYSDLITQAEYLSQSSGMLSLYFNSEFCIWLTYSLYARGLISYE